MRIERYLCESRGEDEWTFPEIEFRRINLLVGDTATGKTRLLNTLFNIGAYVASDLVRPGYWDMTFEQLGSRYRWILVCEGEGDDTEASRIVEEKLFGLGDGSEEVLVDRDLDGFSFKGESLPKLHPRLTSISLLKEEDIIRPIHIGFSSIRRRRFFDDALSNISKLEPVGQQSIKRIKDSASLRTLYDSKLGLNATLYMLSRFFADIFSRINTKFKEAFPFVHETAVRDFSDIARGLTLSEKVPVFCIREQPRGGWIPITEISSGMQKVLLILTDTFALPEGSIYIIDEYENSLGINAIDFFPSFILDLDKEMQFFVTSHHPYIINAIPPQNWYIFHRKGTDVSIKYGHELEERFGKSSQRAFIQLINDPFYVGGVE